jgi:hypothetical protein
MSLATSGASATAPRMIVTCQSTNDGEIVAYGPFPGSTRLEAVAAARRWLRRQPCRPAREDGFWTTPFETRCDGRDGGGTAGCWHTISELAAV